MGDGAIAAFMAETGFSWADAEEILYGGKDKPYPVKLEKNMPKYCPICNRRSKSFEGTMQHCKDVHKKQQHQERIAAFGEKYGKE
jgi:hypothetical protein